MSSSKLSALCDKIIEAGWLSIVVSVPLLITLFSSRSIEPDKLSVMRTVAGIMAAAWLVKWFDQLTARPPAATSQHALRSLRSPLAVPTLLVVAVYLISTIASIAPRVSFLGAYPRPEGTYSVLSYIVVFALVAQGLRSRKQLDRLIVTTILTSIPVALYGVIQHFGLDPLTWSFSSSDRVGSTLGNSIFMGAYLIMVFLLTLGRIINSMRAIRARPQTHPMALSARAAGYSLVGALQGIAIIFSGSRGPWLGMFAGGVLFAMLLALALRRRRLVLGGIGAGLAGLAFLVALNIPGSPLAPLRELPIVGRFVNAATTGTAEVRALMWEGAARLMTPHAPLQFPDGAPDPLNLIRPFVGYGPDSLYLVSTQFSTPDPYSREAVTDRNHNETWDWLVTTGLFGLLAYEMLFLSIFFHGLRQLGLIPTRLKRNLFVGLWVGLGLAGALATVILGQPKYLGVALPLGNAAGLVIYLAITAFRPAGDPPKTDASLSDVILLVALLAGFLAHFVETQFGIAIVATRILFWIFAAVLIAVGSGQIEQEDAAAAVSRPQPQRRPARSTDARSTGPTWVGGVASYALIIALILLTLIYDFVTFAQGAPDPLSLLWRALVYDASSGAASYVMLGLLLATWSVATLIALAELSCDGTLPTLRIRRAAVLTGLVSIGLALVFALGLAAQLCAPSQAESVIARAGRLASIVVYYTISLSVVIVCVATVLAMRSQDAPAKAGSNKWGLVTIAPVTLALAVWTNTVVLNPSRADVAHKLGQDYEARGQWDVSIDLYKHALSLAPSEDFYYMALGRAFKEKSNVADPEPASLFGDHTQPVDILELDAQTTNGLNRVDLLYAAQTMLTRARDLNPLYANHTLNLARFYLPELPTDTPARKALADLSGKYYSQANRLSPYTATLWNEWADFDLKYKNDSDAALRKLEQSLKLDRKLAETYRYLGETYRSRHAIDKAIAAYRSALDLQPGQENVYEALGDVYQAQPDLGRAVEAYHNVFALQLIKFIRLAVTDPAQAYLMKPDLAQIQGRLAYLYAQQGQPAKAVQATLLYIEIVPRSLNVWEAHKNLALLYEQAGDVSKAIEEARIAAGMAPGDVVPQIDELIERLQGSMPSGHISQEWR
jgi:tetratricopeptide (TPR) repeat protein/O-antigen ligase